MLFQVMRMPFAVPLARCFARVLLLKDLVKQESRFRVWMSVRRQNQLHDKSIQVIESEPQARRRIGSIQIHLFEGNSLIQLAIICPLRYHFADLVYCLAPAANRPYPQAP
jgi:hypothetical protein